MKNSRKSPVSVLCRLLGTAILMAVIVICLPLTIPRLFGAHFLAVVSGSMEPEIPTGSLVYVKEAQPQEIQSDEIIAFYGVQDPDSVVTHRVIENHVEDREFITKGDANKTKDMNPVKYVNLIGRVEFHVPKLGFTAQMMTSLPGKAAFGGMIGLSVVLYLLAESLEKKREEE